MLILIPLLGCANLPLACTEEARVSVTVAVVDESGAVVPDAEVAFRLPDSLSFQPCEQWDDSWACGWEQAGELEIRADAQGYEETTEVVTVDEDECHVISEALTLILPAVDCTQEVVPSVLVTVVDTDGSPVSDATGVYEPTDLDLDAPLDCERSGSNELSCGEEIAGEIWLEISAPNRGSWTDTLIVEQDECHVITSTVTAELMVLD